MGDGRSTVTIPRNVHIAVADAIQLAIVDKGASKATRKAAFAALLALIDAGSVEDTSALPAADANCRAPQAA